MMMRRWILRLAVIAILLTAVYDVALLALVFGKLMGSHSTFDYWFGAVDRTNFRIANLDADIYTSRQSKAPLLFVHGVNATGKESQDIRSVAETFAGRGFRVIVPQFDRLTHQNVSPADIDDIERVLNSIDANPGILCVSYGCGPALIAASRPGVRDRVRFIATFGAYYDLTDTLRFIVTSPESPLAYSKWLYMAANSDLLANADDRGAVLALADKRLETASGVDVPLGDEAVNFVSVYDSATPRQFDERIQESPKLLDRTIRLSPSRYIDGLRAPLTIVHMSSDPCIPSSESVRLAQAAQSRHIPHSLTILKMYGHTRPRWPAVKIGSVIGFYVPESLKFARVLYQLLSYAD
jgi:pimeloyl-ACP methyl ester carboxylesterase